MARGCRGFQRGSNADQNCLDPRPSALEDRRHPRAILLRSPPMQLGFVSAVLGELPLEEVFAFAADEGFPFVELMCWPPGKADRRYAGVTHLDVTHFTADHAEMG